MKSAAFMWQGFGSGADCRAGFCENRSCCHITPRQSELVSKGIHCWPETMNDVASSSVITYLRKPKEHCGAAVREERNVRGAAQQTPRSVKKKGEDVLPVWNQRFPEVRREENSKAVCVHAPAPVGGSQWSTNPSAAH